VPASVIARLSEDGAELWYDTAPCTCALTPAHAGQLYRAVVAALNLGVTGSRVPLGAEI